MSHNAVRWSVLGVALLLITGCGGGASGGGGGTTGGNNGGNGGGSQNQPTTITFSFVSGPPTQVAVKLGSGNYTLENLSSNKLTISVPSGTEMYSVAYLCPPFQQEVNDTLELEFIAFESVSDGTLINAGCPGEGDIPTPAMGNLTGTVDASAFPTAATTQIGAWSSNYSVVQGRPVGSFQISAPTGNDRVVLGLYGSSFSDLLAIKNFNNQAVPGAVNGGNTVAFSSSDATTKQPITYTNVPSGYGSPNTSVSVVNGAFQLASSDGTQYAQLPSGVLQSGDYYDVESSVSITSGSQTSTINSSLFPISGGPVTLSFPDPWTTTGPAPASLPTFKFDYAGYAGKTGDFSEGNITWTPASGPQYEILVTATQNYLGSGTSLAVPDLSGVSGFITPPGSGTSVAWLEFLSQSTFPSAPSLAGGATTTVETLGSYLVP
jgi:hypothetical protein